MAKRSRSGSPQKSAGQARDSKRNPIDPAPSSMLPFDQDAPGAVKPSKTAVIVLSAAVLMTFVFGGLALWTYLTN